MIKSIKLLINEQQHCLDQCSDADIGMGLNEQPDDVSLYQESETNEQADSLLSTILCSIRCCAHTLQLAVWDVLKTQGMFLTEVRTIIKQLRANPFRNVFALRTHRKPFLDVPTRWNSTYQMVKCLTDQKDFIMDLISGNTEVEISENLWTFMEDFTTAFQPVFIMTKKIQEVNLTMSDFYLLWLICEVELKEINNEYSKQILSAMDKRKSNIFENSAFIAALYMDPRVNFNGSIHFNDTHRRKAEVCTLF